ncbi:hypothetical protein BDW68DRAFT_175379 [Aspergillus falconensis]
MSSSLDDYLDDLSDYDVDLSDYGLDEDDLDYSDYGLDDDDFDFDYSDYLPTSTSSGSYPTSTSYHWLSGDDNDDDADNDTPSSSDFDMNLDGTPPSGDSSSGDVPSSLGGLDAFGSDYSSQQTSDSCVSEVAFKTTGPKVDLAFDVIFLVLFLGLAVFTVFRLLKINKNGGGMVKWVLFPVSLFFAILYLFLDMITLILSECLIMRYDKYQQAEAAVVWFNRLSVFLLIVTVLLPICLKLQGGGTFRTLTLFANSAWLALTGIFLIVSLALYTRIADARFRTGDYLKPNFLKASRDVSMVTVLTILVLALSTLILTLILMGGFADTNYGDAGRSAKYYEQSGDAQAFLTRLFYAIVFVSALFIAGTNTASEDAAQPTSSMAQTPKPAEYYQPQPATTAPVPAPAPAQH